MDGFIGRERELTLLERSLRRTAAGGRAGRPGRAILMRGRRRVGKSRLAEEFVDRADVPHLYFTASAQPSLRQDLELFVQAAVASSLPGAARFAEQAPTTWDAALTLLASAVPDDHPSIVVLDEMPYLIANDPGFEGSLQKAFDRELSRKPVLLLCIGSDIAMMEALNAYGRPFHQRASEMVVPPLNPADVAGMLRLAPADAFDAYLVSGGLPLVLDEWDEGVAVMDFLADALTDPTSALLVSGERALAAEFPTEAHARVVLSAIGSGERTRTLIGRAAGDMPPSTLSRALDLLIDKRVVESDTPLSTRPSRETRFTVADPHLRFWLAFLGPHMDEIERGRGGDLVLGRIKRSWAAWRGRAIEPVIRESMRRLAPGILPEGTGTIGGYWTRSNDPEIDLVLADRGPIAQQILALGSVKWLDRKQFDGRDLARLHVHRTQIPGGTSETPLVVVSRCGASEAVTEAVDLVLTPERLLAGWL